MHISSQITFRWFYLLLRIEKSRRFVWSLTMAPPLKEKFKFPGVGLCFAVTITTITEWFPGKESVMHVPGMFPDVQFPPNISTSFSPSISSYLEQKTIWYYITLSFSYQSFSVSTLEKLNQKVEIINLYCDSKFHEKL